MVYIGPLKCYFKKSSHVTQKSTTRTIFPILHKNSILIQINLLIYKKDVVCFRSQQVNYVVIFILWEQRRIVESSLNNKKILLKSQYLLSLYLRVTDFIKNVFQQFSLNTLHIFTQVFPSKLKCIIWYVIFNIHIGLKNMNIRIQICKVKKFAVYIKRNHPFFILTL